MARSTASFRTEAEAPFLKNTQGILGSLSEQIKGLTDLQSYLGFAGGNNLIKPQTRALAEKFGVLDEKLAKKERLTQEDYIGVVDATIQLIDSSFINDQTKLETVRKEILHRILQDQDLHHKITSAFSVIEVVAILSTTIIYAINSSLVMPVMTLPLLTGPYIQYRNSKPIYDYREPIPKNYQLHLKQLETEDLRMSNSLAYHIVFIIAFKITIVLAPVAYNKTDVDRLRLGEITSLSVENSSSGSMVQTNFLRGPELYLIAMMLEMLVAYMFLFQSKKDQKAMKKRDEILMPFLEKQPDKNQAFFIKVLEALQVFKDSVEQVRRQRQCDEKEFLRLVTTLNTSLTILETQADPEIKSLFSQTTRLIEELRTRTTQETTTGSKTYPLLDFVRKRVEGNQNLPKKWQNNKNGGTSSEIQAQEPKKQSTESEKLERLKIIKQIHFPQRMKHSECVKFLVFMGGELSRSEGSHFSYGVNDPITGNVYSITVAKKDEHYGDTFKNWIFQSDISPEYVLEKWNQFNA